MAKAVSSLHLFLFVRFSEVATSHPLKEIEQGKSCLVCLFVSPDTILALTVRVSSTALIQYRIQVTASLQPLLMLLSQVSVLPPTILPPRIFFSKKAPSLEMHPTWHDDQTGCNCTALLFRHSAYFGYGAYAFPHS